MPKKSSVGLGPKFDEALLLAHELHRHDVRKGTGKPYISHLLGVCSLVVDYGGEEKMAIAALLHDAVEVDRKSHTSELQSHRYLHSFPTRRSSDLEAVHLTPAGSLLAGARLRRRRKDGYPCIAARCGRR